MRPPAARSESPERSERTDSDAMIEHGADEQDRRAEHAGHGAHIGERLLRLVHRALDGLANVLVELEGLQAGVARVLGLLGRLIGARANSLGHIVEAVAMLRI